MSLLRARSLAASAGGAPVVVLSLQRRRYAGWAKPLLERFRPRLVLVLSQATRQAARAAGLVAEVVPLGVDSLAFRPPEHGEKRSLRQKHGIPDGQVLLHVGHISPSRNLDLLRQTLAPGRHLVVVSSTTTRANPEVRQGLTGSSVIFLDRYVEKIEEIYRLADCYVFPTRDAGGAIEIPLSVLEAMATNLPVVTTDFGGIPDLFKDRVAGERHGLFRAATDKEFIEKLQPALGLADVATRHLVRDLSWDRVAGEILERMDALLPPLAGKGGEG
jgi:glycosyltransferase involved in cell wall biosynthesis